MNTLSIQFLMAFCLIVSVNSFAEDNCSSLNSNPEIEFCRVDFSKIPTRSKKHIGSSYNTKDIQVHAYSVCQAKGKTLPSIREYVALLSKYSAISIKEVVATKETTSEEAEFAVNLRRDQFYVKNLWLKINGEYQVHPLIYNLPESDASLLTGPTSHLISSSSYDTGFSFPPAVLLTEHGLVRSSDDLGLLTICSYLCVPSK